MNDNLFEGSAHHDRISVDTLFLHSSAYPRKAVLVWLRILFLHSIQMLSGVTVIIVFSDKMALFFEIRFKKVLI